MITELIKIKTYVIIRGVFVRLLIITDSLGCKEADFVLNSLLLNLFLR